MNSPSISFKGLLTESERHVAVLLYNAKLKSRVVNGLSGLIKDRNEKGQIIRLRLLHDDREIDMQQKSTIMAVAKALGVTDEKFKDIQKFIAEYHLPV